MMNKKLALTTLRNVVAAGIYIFAVSQILFHADSIFGQMQKSLAPFAFLLLFSVSVAIVGSLVFGQAVMLYLDKKQKEAVESAAFSILWLFVITVVVLATLAIAS